MPQSMKFSLLVLPKNFDTSSWWCLKSGAANLYFYKPKLVRCGTHPHRPRLASAKGDRSGDI